jgi:hypothetical protein
LRFRADETVVPVFRTPEPQSILSTNVSQAMSASVIQPKGALEWCRATRKWRWANQVHRVCETVWLAADVGTSI